ncbi:MAG: hypothetical protein ABII82_13380 [Verrucomicrobiota bacterium]
MRRTLGIARSTFFERVRRGDVEATTIGGKRFYRVTIRGPGAQSGSGPDVRTRTGPQPDEFGPRPGPGGPAQSSPAGPMPDPGGLVPASEVLGLVERYERRIDSLLEAERETRAALDAERARAAELAVRVEHERAAVADAEHRLHVAELHASHQVEQAQTAAQHAQAVAEQERQDAARTRAQLEALQRRLDTLRERESVPWWAWRQRQRLATTAGLLAE